MSEIPARAREHVNARAGGLCERCGAPGTDVHHRRRRREGPDPHNVTNLVRLCRACHNYAHARPLEAAEEGLVVASNVDPASVPATLKLWGVMPAIVYLEEEGYGNFAPILAPAQDLG